MIEPAPRLRVLEPPRRRRRAWRPFLFGLALGLVAGLLLAAAVFAGAAAAGSSSSSIAIASSYTHASAPGRMACTGRPVDDGARTFASLIVPCGSLVRFCTLDASRCTVARRTDSGPFVAGRSFDLTVATVRGLGYGDAYAFGVRAIRWERLA